MAPEDEKSFVVRFANGQGDGTFGSLGEARRVIERRAEYDPPPPGIFPAEIWQRTWVNHAVADERVIERFPGPTSDSAGRRDLPSLVRIAVWLAWLCVIYLNVVLGIWAIRRAGWPFLALDAVALALVALLTAAFAVTEIRRMRARRQA